MCADDIPIQDDVEALDSITEEQEDTEKSKTKGSSVSALKHLPKLPGLSKKHKTKNSPAVEQPQQLEMIPASGDQVNSVVESPPTETQHAVHVSAV